MNIIFRKDHGEHMYTLPYQGNLNDKFVRVILSINQYFEYERNDDIK